ncbi:MAG: hypothetical protein ACI9WC_000805 [Arenicella sp.]|jgi:hypothetical protein
MINTLLLAASLACLNAHAGPQTELQVNQTPTIAAQSKLGPFIRKMATEGDFQSSAMVKVKNQNRVQVYIRLSNAEERDFNELKALNIEIEVINTQLKKVQAWVEIAQLTALSQLANVEGINTPSFAYSRTGGTNTEGDAILKANLLRDLGFSGQGIRVGVVSDGSNDWTSARDSADLPNSLRRFGSCTAQPELIESCISERSCNEGTAMAEIIHDLAPSAELAVAAASTTLEFIQGINQLASVFEADIIVDDLGFYMEPYFEDGDVAKAVAALPSDILFISAAGNNGNNHYEADFNVDNDSAFQGHEFNTNVNALFRDQMGIIIPARSFVFAYLQWNEEFDTPSTDYDFFITGEKGAVLGGGLGDQSTPGSLTTEAACVPNTSSTDLTLARTFVKVRKKNGGPNRRFEMFFIGSPLIQFPVPEGSIFGHSGLTRTLSVAAINAVDPGNDDIATYSSRGPSRIDFPNRQNRRKPDLTAIDGVTVSGAGGFSTTFFGTSAAAPHVAGIAAQLMSSSDRANAKTVHKALTRGALNLGPSGFDSTYGFGLVDAILANTKLNQSNPIGPIMLLLGDDED